MSIAEALCPFTPPLFGPDAECLPALSESPLTGVKVGDILHIQDDGIATPWYAPVIRVGVETVRVSCPNHQKEMLQYMDFWLTGSEAGREVCRPEKAYRATARPATAEEIAPFTAAPVQSGEGGERG